MKRIIISVGCLIISAIFAVGCSLATGKDVYNESPNLSQKVIGSKAFFPDQLPMNTIDDLTKNANSIIIGEVISDGELSQFNMYGDEEFAKDELAAGRNPYMPCTITKIRVEESIYGDIPTESEIDFFQLGVPGSNSLQTKVNQGERLVMILQAPDSKEHYYSANVEHTIFYLDENNIVTSMSDELICARYDGTSKDFLVNDLLKGLSS